MDRFIPDPGSRLASPSPARSMRLVQRLALGLVGVAVLIGVGAVALTLGNHTAVPPANHAAPVQAERAGEPATVDDLTTASIAPAGAAEAQAPPTQVAEPQRDSKSDRMAVWSPQKRAALGPSIEPSMVAARQEVWQPAPRTPPAPQARSSGPETAPVKQPRPPRPAAREAEPEATAGDDAETAALSAAVSEALSEPDAAAVAKPVPEPEPEPEPAAATRTAPVLDDVNMRAGPANEAAVITVVPNGSRVEVIDCNYWCEVRYSGKRGWIYKRFIRGAS